MERKRERKREREEGRKKEREERNSEYSVFVLCESEYERGLRRLFHLLLSLQIFQD
jgi:hypothetical protein